VETSEQKRREVLLKKKNEKRGRPGPRGGMGCKKKGIISERRGEGREREIAGSVVRRDRRKGIAERESVRQLVYQGKRSEKRTEGRGRAEGKTAQRSDEARTTSSRKKTEYTRQPPSGKEDLAECGTIEKSRYVRFK